MNTPEIITCAWIVLGILTALYLFYSYGHLRGKEKGYTDGLRESALRFRDGYDRGKKVGYSEGYTRGRAEGYEDGRRYEAVTHHNQAELERELAKGLNDK